MFDVTEGRRIYGPGGYYSFFSGKDASRAYVTGCFQTHLTYDVRDFDDKQMSVSDSSLTPGHISSTRDFVTCRTEHVKLKVVGLTGLAQTRTILTQNLLPLLISNMSRPSRTLFLGETSTPITTSTSRLAELCYHRSIQAYLCQSRATTRRRRGVRI